MRDRQVVFDLLMDVNVHFLVFFLCKIGLVSTFFFFNFLFSPSMQTEVVF